MGMPPCALAFGDWALHAVHGDCHARERPDRIPVSQWDCGDYHVTTVAAEIALHPMDAPANNHRSFLTAAVTTISTRVPDLAISH